MLIGSQWGVLVSLLHSVWAIGLIESVPLESIMTSPQISRVLGYGQLYFLLDLFRIMYAPKLATRLAMGVHHVISFLLLHVSYTYQEQWFLVVAVVRGYYVAEISNLWLFIYDLGGRNWSWSAKLPGTLLYVYCRLIWMTQLWWWAQTHFYYPARLNLVVVPILLIGWYFSYRLLKIALFA